MDIRIDLANQKPISDKLYGLFFEDINFSIDGGINSNQINNARFIFRQRKPIKNLSYRLRRIKKYRKRIIFNEIADPLRYWKGENVMLSAVKLDNIDKYYMLAKTEGGKIINLGYNGGDGHEKKGRYLRRQSTLGAIGVKCGNEYILHFRVKNISFKGEISAYISHEGKELTEPTFFKAINDDWSIVSSIVRATNDGIGSFILKLDGKGEIAFDRFYFGDKNALGEGDTRYSGGRFRKDLVDALKELNPKFIRFPGGCIVEGYNTLNSYYWKYTVGDILNRKAQINLWGDAQKDGGYMQSYEIGFYEYFLLCEELNAEPLPIINAGLACQGRTTEHTKAGTEDFKRYIDDALDLIEFANGDPKISEWASLRAKMGHEKPFNMHMLGIGNENFGEVYMQNFAAIKAAVKSKYPDMEIIWSAGFDCYKHPKYIELRKAFDGVHDDCIVDDHFYRKPEWCIENASLYDDYNGKARIFLGEYAANTSWDDKSLPNNYYSALAEAAFLTGLERNADKVIMSSYAPLFSRIGGEQWKHNLINYNSLYTLRTANFYVQKLFANNFGANYIDCGNTEDGVFRSATTDGRYVYIKAVNVNRTAKNVNFIVDGALSAETFIMSCPDDYMRNTLTFYGKPKEPITPISSTLKFTKNTAFLSLPERSCVVIKVKLGSK